MTRYIVNVVVSGRSASLLIVLPNTALVLDLVDKVKARLLGLKLGITSTTDLELTPRINSVDGPILDTEDLLLDALPDSTKEQLFVVIGSTEAPDHSTASSLPICFTTEVLHKDYLVLLVLIQICLWNLSLWKRAPCSSS
jgi:hypothetical protein